MSAPRPTLLLIAAIVMTGCGGGVSTSSAPSGAPAANPPPATSPPPATPVPTVDLTANSTTVYQGGSATLNWSSTDTNGCIAGGAWSGSKPVTGSQGTGALNTLGTHIFTLECSGSGGSAGASVSVTVQSPPPPGASLTVGYNATTRTVTAATVVLDLAQPAAGNYPVWVSGVGYPNLVRAATHERFATGGYFNRGFSRFLPGHVIDGHRGEHYCGVGQIFGFNNVGDSSRMVVGMLIRYGTTFFADMASSAPMYGDIKQLILVNDSGERPMTITKGGTTRVLGACDGTVCNTTNSTTDIDWFNERGHAPNIDAYLGQWLWVEFAFNSSEPFTRVRTWSADGTLSGAETIAPWASPGRVTMLDIIGFVNAIPTPGAQPYYDLERVEFRVGTDANLTPPAGFPGSTR